MRDGTEMNRMELQLSDDALIERIEVGPLATNSYLYTCKETAETAVVDPGAEAELLLSVMEERGYSLKLILLTHGHIDHVGAASRLHEVTGAPVFVHKKDAGMVASPDLAFAALFGMSVQPCVIDTYLTEGMELKVGSLPLVVRETPGHSPGSVCFVGAGYSFCGDLVFAGSIGRTDLPGGSYPRIMKSIRDVVLRLEGNHTLLPGHGPETTVGTEALSNPYVIEASRLIGS